MREKTKVARIKNLMDGDHEHLHCQPKDSKRKDTLILFSPTEDKWIQACLVINNGGRDRTRGSLYWNFRLEDSIWDGGTYIFWDTLWGFCEESI